MNGLPFEKLPASRPDPRILVQQQYDRSLRQLDTEWEEKYQDLNRKYDWSRQDRDPDEIGRIRGMLRSQIEGRKRKLQTAHKQQTDQFNLVDQLLDPAKAEEVKWRIMLGPEIEKGMFPTPAKPVDWRLEHQRAVLERGRLLSLVASYKLDSKGRLYGVDDAGKLDKSLPATEAESQGWIQSIKALESLHIYEREQILPNLTTADIAPTRLQELLLEKQERSWFKDVKWRLGKFLPQHIFTRRGRPPVGTFADKVTATMRQPITEPEVKKPVEQKITRKQLLTEYKRLGGGQTAEGREFADRYLR